MRKRSICIIFALVVVTAILVGLAVRYVPSVVPYWQCSEVYKRYKDVEGIKASYVKNYPLNDTLTVGVTLLEATTDSGWAVLQEDFGVPVIPKEFEELFYGDSNRVSVKGYHKCVPICSNGDTLADDLIAISLFKHTIAYFEVQDSGQLKAILYKQCDDNIRNDNLKYSNYEENN